jgi:hypothetical protein
VFDHNPNLYEYSPTDSVIMYARTHNAAYIEDAITRVEEQVKAAEEAVVKTGTFTVEAVYLNQAEEEGSTGTTQVAVNSPPAAAPQTAAAADSTSTTLSCTPGSLNLGERTSCEATVHDTTGAAAPLGEVEFRSDRGGTFLVPENKCHLATGANASSSCKATFIPSEAPLAAHDSYLEVGGMLEDLALAYDYGLEAGKLTPQQEQRWKAYGDKVLSNLWSPETATWGANPPGTFAWSGWAINDPGDNYHFSFVKATQMWALATQNHAWMDFLQAYKFPRIVDYYAAIPGGGSREGTGYGASQKNLWEDARMWRDSTGEDLTAVRTHARESIEYWINATVPTLNYFAPIGDLSRVSLPELFDYHENVVREAVMAAPGTEQARHGVWWLHENSVPDLLTQGFTLRTALLTPTDPPQEPTALTYHATGVGQFFTRSSWDRDATWLQFTAGPYDQSHAHEDQGGFTLYRNTWLSVTSNIWSHGGLEGVSNEGIGVGASNVLRFSRAGQAGSPPEVIPQNFSTSTETSETSGKRVTVHANLSNAYSDNSDAVQSWKRDLEFEENELHIHDTCQVAQNVSAVFQLHVPVEPKVNGGGSITAGALQIAIPPSYGVSLVDMHQLSSDFESGWRIDISNPGGCEFNVGLTALAAPPGS